MPTGSSAQLSNVSLGDALNRVQLRLSVGGSDWERCGSSVCSCAWRSESGLPPEGSRLVGPVPIGIASTRGSDEGH